MTKGHGVNSVSELKMLGFTSFGENYWQELSEKATSPLLAGCSWVFIGRIQSNKIGRLVALCDEIQSVSTWDQARLIAKAAENIGKRPYPIYVQVNSSAEESKGGIALSGVSELVHRIRETLPQLELRGLMSIPEIPKAANVDGDSENGVPMLLDPIHVPASYLALRDLSRELGFAELSLGMSMDIEWAIYAGSTCLRLGQSLVGVRIR